MQYKQTLPASFISHAKTITMMFSIARQI